MNPSKVITFERRCKRALGMLRCGMPVNAGQEIQGFLNKNLGLFKKEREFLIGVRILCYSSSPRHADLPLERRLGLSSDQ